MNIIPLVKTKPVFANKPRGKYKHIKATANIVSHIAIA